MEKIQHSHVQARGLKLHVAQIGTGPKVVLFLHGFPEIWYSWRHQMIAVANAGFRAIAFDSRGYGLSDHPPEPEKANFKDLVDDVVALLDLLGINKVFLVGKDFGAVPAFMVAVIHPERVLGVITLGIPFLVPGPVGIQFDLLPKGFYVLRWAEPGRAEADFGRFDVKTVVRNIYILFCRSELQVAGENEEIMDLVDPSTPLPPWFTEEDLEVYAALYQNSGFRTALQVPYRCSQLDYGITNPKVTAPSLLIMGEKDYFMKFPGMEEYMNYVFLVGKDFGAVPAFMVAVIHPERVLGVITLGIPFLVPGPVGIQFDLLPKGFYVLRWAEPGRAEADFGRFDVKTVVRNIYILFCRSELQVAGENEEIMDLVDPSTPLPPWFTEEDLEVYAALYQNSGFRTALQVPYRCSQLDYGITNPKVTAPSLLIMGEKDYFMKFPGMEEYMKKGIVKQFMPNLDITFMSEGNHFVQEQLPEQVNELIITFLNKN